MPTRIYQTWTVICDIPDMDQSEERVDEEPADEPAVEPSVSPSTSPVPSPDSPSPSPKQPEPVVPLPRKPARFGRRSAPVNVTQSRCLAGGLGLAAALSAADAHTDSFGPDWEVPSERAGGEVQCYSVLRLCLGIIVFNRSWSLRHRCCGPSQAQNKSLDMVREN